MSLLEYQEERIKKTRDIINLINHTENIGIESQKILDEQYEKLQRCDNLTENINVNLELSSNILGRIKHFFFSRKACNIEKIPKNIEDKNISLIQIKSDIVDKNISNKLDKHLNKDMENELNDNLDEINYGVNNLKNIAISINKQLDLDTKLLDKINSKSEINNNNIKKINKEINKLL